jgi:NADH-quinone oxidoreductase subunit M
MQTLLDQHLLSVLVFLPAVGAAFVVAFPASATRAARSFALAVAVLEFALSIPLWTRFAVGSPNFQFAESLDWIPAIGISYALGLDGLSLLLVLRRPC